VSEGRRWLRGLGFGLATMGSAVAGLFLIAAGIIARQERTVAAGKRRFHGFAFERRWIDDAEERERHAAVVAERLDLPDDPARGP
jgi:hypothetical protein